MDRIKPLAKIQPEILRTYPFKFLLVKDFLDYSDFDALYSELMVLENTEPHSEFKSSFGVKQEWKAPTSNDGHIYKFLDFLSSDLFIGKLKLAFSIDKQINLYYDRTYDGGGYVKSPPNSFLSYHADFNFSSKIEKYRSINVLFYANKNYEKEYGGVLHCLDSESKTVEVEVQPEANTLFAFLTDDLAFHGVSKNSSTFTRRSFNVYYYTDQPLSSRQNLAPHKTIWMDFENSNHSH